MITSVIDVTAVLAGLSAIGTAIAASLWWMYRRGKASVRPEAELKDLRRAVENLEGRVTRLESERDRKRSGPRWRNGR